MNDGIFIRKLEIFNEALYVKLEKRRRAIANWRRLKVVLAILKICGNRMEHERHRIEEKEVKEKKTLDEWMVKYIKLPTSATKISWNIFICNIYVISFFADPFCLVFWFPLWISWIKTTQTIFSILMVIDILYTFITAY